MKITRNQSKRKANKTHNNTTNNWDPGSNFGARMNRNAAPTLSLQVRHSLLTEMGFNYEKLN